LLEPYTVSIEHLRDRHDRYLKKEGKTPSNELKIAHLDLYRLQEPEELDYIGGRDLKAAYQIIFVEWPEKALGFMPGYDVNIQLNHRDTGRELVLLSKFSDLTL